MNLEDFNLKINNNFSSQDAESVAIFLKERMKEGNELYSRISEDDIERILLVGLLLEKKQSSGNSHFARITEWRDIGEDAVYFKMKSILEDMNVKLIVQSLTFALGGTAMFTIVERQGYVDYLYDEIKAVLEKIRKKDDKQGEIMALSQEERDDSRILADLKRFKRVVERDGYIAFWLDSSTGKGLKNHPEEIARAQLMSFLAGQGIYDKGTEFREVNEGAGRADVMRVESGGVKRLFELKVISNNINRFEEGFNQLFAYMDKENINTSFYLVFESRSSSERTFVEQRTISGKKVMVIVIDLFQSPPTKY